MTPRGRAIIRYINSRKGRGNKLGRWDGARPRGNADATGGMITARAYRATRVIAPYERPLVISELSMPR
jgi:hypothetical protein